MWYIYILTDGDLMKKIIILFVTFVFKKIGINYHKNRKKIYKLLKSKGYSLKYSGLSRWDDWYVKDSINLIQ